MKKTSTGKLSFGSTAARELLPNFVVVGAPKCGTTSLYFYLSDHPQVFLPHQKELHYFSREFLMKNMNGPGDTNMLASICKSMKEYRSHYKGARDEVAVGEFSPSYLYFHEVAPSIAETLGHPKIIVMLRNPVEKAYSQYMHLIRSERETVSFEQALDAERDRIKFGWSDFWRYAESSVYSHRLRTYLDIFGAQRVKVVIFDEFARNPGAIVKEICEFLEVDTSVPLGTDRVYNRSGRPRIKVLAKILSQPNIFKSALKNFIPGFLRAQLRLKLISVNTKAVKEPVSGHVRERLTDYFKEDVANLEKLVGHGLPWNKF
jgi:hypothetical protein